MKAGVLENKQEIRYKQVPTPHLNYDQVLLQVKAVSICGSDIIRFSKGHRTYPIILGHECAGVVAEVGAAVSPSLIGKHAAVIPVIPCFACEPCARGYYSACHQYSFIGTRQNGGFADYIVMLERNLLILPDTIPFEQAALIEPATVARHILDLGEFHAGQQVIVLGAGSVGLMAVQWLRILGAGLIVCTDLIEDNLRAAKMLGAHVALNPKETDVNARVKELCGDGVDLALEVAGSPQTLAQTIRVTRPRGIVVCGGNQPADKTLPMSFIEELMRKELRLVGCFMSYSAPFPGHEWSDSVQMIQTGQLNLGEMISHRFPLSQIEKVFGDLAARTLPHRKIVLNPSG